METPATVRFARLAARLAAACRAAGLEPPAFRSPPRLPGATRTVRRLPAGTVVAVTLRGRPFAEVARDMVEGIVVANGLRGDAAVRVRTALLESLRTEPRRAA